MNDLCQAHISGIADFLVAKASRRFLALSKKKDGLQKAFQFLWLPHVLAIDDDRVHSRLTCKASERLDTKLNALGSYKNVFVASDNSEIETGIFSLSEAVSLVENSGFFSLISCKPGKLLYFEGEWSDDSEIFIRR